MIQYLNFHIGLLAAKWSRGTDKYCVSGDGVSLSGPGPARKMKEAQVGKHTAKNANADARRIAAAKLWAQTFDGDVVFVSNAHW